MKAEGRMPQAGSLDLGQFQRDGFQIVRSLVDPPACDGLAAELTPLFEQQQQAAKSKIGGVRNLLRTNASVSKFSQSARVLSILEQFCGSPMFPVRAIFFDKIPGANWRVPWHQDLAIAVAGKIETPGFTGWSRKDGVLHVHPPPEILEHMVTVRLHLDDCAADNGALRVVPGSHRQGKLGAADISKWTGANPAVVCEAAKGDALLLRPLLLHASPPAETPGHRRVLHVEYSAQPLPNGLQWFAC